MAVHEQAPHRFAGLVVQRFQIKDSENKACQHCELSVNGHLFMVVSEVPDICDVDSNFGIPVTLIS